MSKRTVPVLPVLCMSALAAEACASGIIAGTNVEHMSPGFIPGVLFGAAMIGLLIGSLIAIAFNVTWIADRSSSGE